MSEYKPDEWCLVRVTGTHPHYRVFGSWRGGYLDGDAWRLNSGIVSVNRSENNSDVLEFHGNTGSIYYCNVNNQGIRSPYNSAELHRITNNDHAHVIDEMDINEIVKMDWSI